MAYDEKTYTPLSFDVLKVGMKIDYGIYYKAKNNYVLLCQDVVLGASYLSSLNEIVNRQNIYVPNEKVEELLGESKLLTEIPDNPSHFEGYAEMKSDTLDLLSAAQENNTVSMDNVSEIIKSITNKIDTVETSVIVENVNKIRSVDEYLHTHCVNVSLLNGLIGKKMSLDDKSVSTLVNIGLLQDIGKLLVPPEILNKPGKLTDEEFVQMKLHSDHGYNLLIESKCEDQVLLNGVAQHHEKLNGRGYCKGLTGNDISIYARITSVSDVYDAMVTQRCYKEPHPPFSILKKFKDGQFNDLDEAFVSIFIDVMVNELKGKTFLLSNGALGKVLHIHMSDLEYPTMDIDGKIICTTENLYPLSIK
jgi:HD-GYP domain-containing protein (c-di-GMP phosphodiesterase class II)